MKTHTWSVEMSRCVSTVPLFLYYCPVTISLIDMMMDLYLSYSILHIGKFPSDSFLTFSDFFFGLWPHFGITNFWQPQKYIFLKFIFDHLCFIVLYKKRVKFKKRIIRYKYVLTDDPFWIRGGPTWGVDPQVGNHWSKCDCDVMMESEDESCVKWRNKNKDPI